MNRANLVVVFMIQVLATAGCSTPDKTRLALTPEQLKEREAAGAQITDELWRYYADLSARKWNAFASHFWPGATITTIWQPPGESSQRVMVGTVPDFVRIAPQGPGSKPVFEERMTSSEVDVRGSMAVVWAKYHARFGDLDDIAEWDGLDVFTLMRHDGRWRIVSLAFEPEN